MRVVQSPTGGGFGGKEDYPEILGSALAVAAWHLHRPVRLVLDREEDLAFTTKRHPAVLRYRTALDGEGEILGMEIDLTLDGGAHESYSAVVLQRALFTATGVYDLPNVRVRGRACVSHLPPTGAFRGFGAPQAIFGIETHLLHLARELGREPVRVQAPPLAAAGLGHGDRGDDPRGGRCWSGCWRTPRCFPAGGRRPAAAGGRGAVKAGGAGSASPSSCTAAGSPGTGSRRSSGPGRGCAAWRTGGWRSWRRAPRWGRGWPPPSGGSWPTSWASPRPRSSTRSRTPPGCPTRGPRWPPAPP